MKATGIVRKIDELGRIVIPKEIRKKLKIREGDPLEIYVSEHSEVILEKYAPMGDIQETAENFVNTIFSVNKLPCIISDTQRVIAVAGVPAKEYLNKDISESVINLLEDRTIWSTKNEAPIKILEEDLKSKYVSQVIVPIISDGDVIGSVIIFSLDSRNLISELEMKLAQTVAMILGKNIE